MNSRRRHDVDSPQARLLRFRRLNWAQWFARSHLAVVLLAMAAVCVPATQAAGEWVVLKLEAYAPSTLPTVSTTIDVPDIDDQLDISRRGVLFAIAPEGWDLGRFGGFLIQRDPPLWTASICRVEIPASDPQLSTLLGYDLNQEARDYGPPTFGLWFHTDAWCERLSHQVGESPNNYGVISGAMGGIWEQCPVPNWGRFSVQPVPEPATLALRVVGGLLVARRRW